MKKAYLILVSLFISAWSFGQELTENFDYGTTSDDLINVGFNWVNMPGSGGETPLIGYSTTSLIMPDYEPVIIGGSAKLNIAGSPGQTGQDLHLQVSQQDTGTVYLSALVNVTFVRTGGSDYFLHLNVGYYDGNYNNDSDRARIFVKDSGSGGINFGILSAGESTDVSWGPNNYNIGTTYLIVAAYDIASGTSKLYVLTAPVPNEPTQANASHQVPGVISISAVSIRQEPYGPSATIDGLKVATNWADLWPPLYFPDANLATAMSNYTSTIDTSTDGEISLEEAAAYNGVLDFSNLGIDDVTGLQFFTGISELNISGNNISDLDLLFNNESNTTSKNNQAKSFSDQSFSGLLVLDCSDNNLTSLDLSGVTTLTSLDCSNNQLENLNVKNGNNTVLTSFAATNNANLSCVQVDNAAWSLSNWTNIDNQSTFNEDCSSLSIKDYSKIELKIFPNPVKNILNLKSKEHFEKVSIFNLLGQEIKSYNRENLIDNKINVTDFNSGVYLINIKINGSIKAIKFVKE